MSGWASQESYRAHYEANKEKYIDSNLRARARTRAYIDAAKSKPCADCGESYPPYVMDFDHRGDKEFAIGSVRASSMSIERLQLEIVKCDVVCSNCHRIRTHTRGYTNKKTQIP